MFDSEPEPELNNRIMYQPRGKVLGGTSSINGMVYMRGNAADYDEWRQRGCEGWDYDSVLPYFKQAEDQERGADEFHGIGGPLQVSDHRWQPTLGQGDARGRARGRHPGQSRLQRRQPGRRRLLPDHDQQRARRWSSAAGLSAPARKQRQNLTIATTAHATRVLIENGRAVGVEYRTPDGPARRRAPRARSSSRAASTARRSS